MALIAKSEGLCDEIPQMEWWDSVILVDNLDTEIDGKIAIKENAINTLVEHPTQMRCPSKLLLLSDLFCFFLFYLQNTICVLSKCKSGKF